VRTRGKWGLSFHDFVRTSFMDDLFYDRKLNANNYVKVLSINLCNYHCQT